MSEPLFSFFILVTASAFPRLILESISSRWIAAEQRMRLYKARVVVEKRPRRSGLQTDYDRKIEHEDLKRTPQGTLSGRAGDRRSLCPRNASTSDRIAGVSRAGQPRNRAVHVSIWEQSSAPPARGQGGRRYLRSNDTQRFLSA